MCDKQACAFYSNGGCLALTRNDCKNCSWFTTSAQKKASEIRARELFEALPVDKQYEYRHTYYGKG